MRACKKCRGIYEPKNKKSSELGYCSQECLAARTTSKKRCEPACDLKNSYFETIIFKNDIKHTRQRCRNCESAKYVPRDHSEDIQHQVQAAKKKSELVRKRYSSSFYNTPEWLTLRFQTFLEQGRRCACCGDTENSLHVDHIQPISIAPNRRLDPTNLQVLCRDCNLGKSNKDDTDFRSSE